MTCSIYTRMTETAYIEINVNVVNSAGAPVDLTNVDSISWGLSPNENTTAVLTKTYPGGGIDLLDADSGLLSIAISGTDTSGLGGKTYFQQVSYDLNGMTIVPFRGTIKIDPIII